MQGQDAVRFEIDRWILLGHLAAVVTTLARVCGCKRKRDELDPRAGERGYFPSNSAFSGSFFQPNVLANSAGV